MVKTPRIMRGTPEALDATPLGRPVDISGFLNRFVLLNSEVCEGAPAHMAVHLIQDLADLPEPYVDAHRHPACDEIGLVLGQPGALEYEMVLNGDVHKVHSPAAIFIPAGTVHRARAMRGTGAYVCMLMDPKGPAPSNTAKDPGS